MVCIKELPSHERPREKLLRGDTLSTAELLALLLHTGGGGDNSIGLANALLARFGGLRSLLLAPKEALLSVIGVGPAKVARLKCIAELIHRLLRERLVLRPTITSIEDVVALIAPHLRDKAREQFLLITLNSTNEVISLSEAGNGTVNALSVYPRELAKRALAEQATAVVLAHNHPDGAPEPSAEDRHLTKHISALFASLGIVVHDHVIIGRNETFSFRESGLLTASIPVEGPGGS